MSAQESTLAAGRNGSVLDPLCIGLPDAITGLWCLWVWLQPMAFGPEAVKCVVLMLLMEFFLLNATGFFTVIPFLARTGRRTRVVMLGIQCAVYLALVAAFAAQFQSVWPYLAFGWMAAGKVAWAVRNRRASASEQMWLVASWAIAVVVYLGAVGLGELAAVPELGIHSVIVPQLQLPRGGEWVDTPHRAVASAVVYFLTIAALKWGYVAIRRSRQGRQQAHPETAIDGHVGRA